MEVNSYDFEQYKKYKGISDEMVILPGECITCKFPELRHFHLPRPRNAGEEFVQPIQRKTLDPSSAPSTPPNYDATYVSSSAPSSKPTSLATYADNEVIERTVSPTLSPNIDASSSQNNGPTAMPTRDTTSPTYDSSATNRDSGFNESCVSDENGDFLIPSQVTTSEKVITYKYRMDTQKDGANITSEVIPFLEKKLLDSILPNLFHDQCSSRRKMYQRMQHERRLNIIGASSRPADTISTSGK
jgi:hypothetical protein